MSERKPNVKKLAQGLLDHMTVLPQHYTVIDPTTGRIKLNPDGTCYYENYVQITVGQEEVAALRALAERPS